MALEILMPALSPTMEEGTLAKWLVAEGDRVQSGDLLAEIETDKATMEFEAVDEGVIGKILVAEGTSNVKVNSAIAILLEDGDAADATAVPAQSTEVAATPTPVTSTANATAPNETGHTAPTPVSSNDGTRIFASPLARRIAADQGLDLVKITGSGPKGRIVKADVSAAPDTAAISAAAPAAAGGAAAAEDKDDFTIMLVSAGDKKINVIKEVRAATSLGLKEAKDLVEGAPKEVKAGVPKKEAEEIKAKLEAAGAKVELK